jgi:hypothetical protein
MGRTGGGERGSKRATRKDALLGRSYSELRPLSAASPGCPGHYPRAPEGRTNGATGGGGEGGGGGALFANLTVIKSERGKSGAITRTKFVEPGTRFDKSVLVSAAFFFFLFSLFNTSDLPDLLLPGAIRSPLLDSQWEAGNEDGIAPNYIAMRSRYSNSYCSKALNSLINP